MKKFIPKSPDKFLKKEADMSLAKFGHLNEIVSVINQITDNVYADNTAALAAGLEVGTLYSTSTGEVRVVVAP
jgi:hypothetical protein